MALTPPPLKRSSLAISPELSMTTEAKAKLTVKRCSVIIAKLDGMQGIPPSLRDMLKRLSQGIVAKGRRHIDEAAATAILGKALKGIDNSLQSALEELQATVNGADAEKEERIAAVTRAESNLEQLKTVVMEKKLAIVTSEKDVEAKREAITNARSAHKCAEIEVKTFESKKKHLEVVEKDKYEPLKDAPADGVDGRKCLMSLRKVGKDFGFHEELLSVLPAILRKQPDKRRTFDGLAMQQFEVELARHVGKLEAMIKDNGRAVADRACDVTTAQEALAAAKDAQKRSARELAAAENAVTVGKKMLVEAKQRVRHFPLDMRRAASNVTKAKACLHKFHRGPLASYERALQTPVRRVAAPQTRKFARLANFDATGAARDSHAEGVEADDIGGVVGGSATNVGGELMVRAEILDSDMAMEGDEESEKEDETAEEEMEEEMDEDSSISALHPTD